jgi:hypothetical protein
VAETPVERRRCIVCSEAVKKHAARKYTNCGPTPLLSLAPCTHYASGASSSCCCPRSATPPPSSSFDDDEADLGRIIGPDDFVNDSAEEERALAEALDQTAEEVERLTALCAIEDFRAREAARTQRMAEAKQRVVAAARGLLPPPPSPPPLLVRRHHHRQAPVSSPGAEFC